MSKAMSRRTFISASGATFAAVILAGCSGSNASSSASASATSTSASSASAQSSINYMVLVNKQHPLPEGWEDAIELESFTNTVDSKVDVEKKAYTAYLDLKKELEAEGVYVDLDSAYRPVADQQRIWDEFMQQYGEEYTKRTVAVPGYSEHHTGLALDLYLIVDGKNIDENEDMMALPEIWEKIHPKLADHGFILRYLPQRKIFTGYSYEPWHIRYLDDPAIAREITEKGLTYEEYLNEVDPSIAGCVVDYGQSEIYKDADIDTALDAILAEFANWEGCTMQRIAYAGDELATSKLDYVNGLREEGTDEFSQAIVFLTDFHSPSAEQAKETAWKPDTDYKDYGWFLGRTGADGAWKLLTWGWGETEA